MTNMVIQSQRIAGIGFHIVPCRHPCWPGAWTEVFPRSLPSVPVVTDVGQVRPNNARQPNKIDSADHGAALPNETHHERIH